MIIDFPHDTKPLKAFWKLSFGDPDSFIDSFFRTGFVRRRCRCVYADDKPVSVLYWFDCLWQKRPVAYLYAIATAPQYRGQGLCRQLLENTHDYLAGLGYAGAVLVPAEDGLFSMYEKLGYRPFGGLEKVTVSARGPALDLQRISPADYLRRRAGLAPENSILHREDAYAFAATYTEFFTAESSIFCAAKEQDTVYFQEYLGDPDLLPGIVSAMDAKKGIVRLPGKTPLAMYHGFSQSDLPAYFNIPLD